MQNEYQFHWKNIITEVYFSNSSCITEIMHFKKYLLVVCLTRSQEHIIQWKGGIIEQMLQMKSLLSDIGHLTKVIRCEIDQCAHGKWGEGFILVPIYPLCISAIQLLFEKHTDKLIPLRLKCVRIGQRIELFCRVLELYPTSIQFFPFSSTKD